MMKKNILLVFGMFMMLNALASEAVFSEANALYQNEKFEEALTKYKQVESAQISGELFYNMGNVYFKIGNKAMAILYYEKALKYGYDDEDLAYNLGLVRAQLIDQIDRIPEFFLTSGLNKVALSMHFDFWAKISLAFLVLMVVGMILFYLKQDPGAKRMFFTFGVAFGVLFITTTLFAKKGYALKMVDRSGVVTVSSVTCKGSPVETGTDLFVIHEGIKVRIEDEVGEWFQIKLEDGNKGWIKSSDLAVI